MNRVSIFSMLAITFAATWLSGCASTQGHSNQQSLGSQMAQNIVSPLLAETLVRAEDGETVLLRDHPWQGYAATRMAYYTAASGRSCMRLKLEHQMQTSIKLLCQQPNQLWAVAPVF